MTAQHKCREPRHRWMHPARRIQPDLTPIAPCEEPGVSHHPQGWCRSRDGLQLIPKPRWVDRAGQDAGTLSWRANPTPQPGLRRRLSWRVAADRRLSLVFAAASHVWRLNFALVPPSKRIWLRLRLRLRRGAF